jgi:hypothetical protein
MRKLQVKVGDYWEYVFARNGSNKAEVITCQGRTWALPTRACWAEDDLAWFREKFPEREFRLLSVVAEKEYQS